MINDLENKSIKNLSCPCCNETLFDEKFNVVFNKFLEKVNKKNIYYIEGYRCENYNDLMDGDKNSPHTKGGAIDFHFNKTENVIDIYDIAKLYFPRIGLYLNVNNEVYMHVDIFSENNNLYWVKDKEQYIYFKTYLDFERWIKIKFKDYKI